MLIQLKQYLQQHPQVSVQDVARYFDVSESMAKSLLSYWQDKGFVIELSCDSCNGCHDKPTFYQWCPQKDTHMLNS